MKSSAYMSRLLAGIFLCAFILVFVMNAGALTTGETYTITVQKVNSDGSLNSASSSSSATADSNGKVAFSLSNVPDNSSCNFLVINILDESSTTVRRSIVPCPNSGEALPVGVSGLTNAQTDALIAALAAAGTDDPILAVFGFAIVRSTAASSSELALMAIFASQGISGTGGFVDYLTSNGVSSSQMTAYRSSIISHLADKDDGYSKYIKDSVDATSDSAKFNARGEAASKLLLVLVQAATAADISQDRILEAFNAMGSVVVPLMMTAVSDGDLSAPTQKMIDSSIGGGIEKLKADKEIEKYSQALTTLGATGDDVTNYQTAANTLRNTMTSIFQTFEQVFDGNETDTDIQNAQTTMDSAMNTAFSQFMDDTAASNTRLTTMIANIDSALGLSTGLTTSEFQFYKSDGTSVNWPLTMVILTDWVSSIVSSGGGVTYTRDTTALPAAITWMGSCTVNGYYDKNSCENVGSGTWTADRTNFGPGGQDIPASYATIFGIQEDIMILEFKRWNDQMSAGNNMGAHEALEKDFSDKVAGLASNISGTTDGSTAVSSIQKSAIVTLLKSPQF